MASERHFSPVDRLLLQADAALRTLLPFSGQPTRPSPAIVQPEAELDGQQAQHVAGLMRINHTGEVCAQALYQGQALTAKLPQVRKAMEHAADEEIDHLAWCEQEDQKSRAIVEQMRVDEEQHACNALDAGGLRFPAPVKFGMSLLAKVMTSTTYRV